ncbi:unnamed protein product [Somion occarium]|uniref:DUF6534 domain-containing protein n=1 Tax=Somion occarium TaxID=3059160 RepID=A0ABP1DYB1_9APHY
MTTLSSLPAFAGGFIESFGIGCILYGINVAQGYIYLLSCERDPMWMKWMAGTLMMLETLHTAFFLRQLYAYSILSIENPSNLAKMDWSVPVSLILEALVQMIVEGFYIHRMWKFSNNVTLAVGSIVLLLARHGGFLCNVSVYICPPAVKCFGGTWSSVTDPVMKGVFLTSLCLTIISDGMMAMIMVFYLNRSKGGLQRTRSIVDWLVMYYVNTGAALTLLAVCILIIHLALPNSLLYVGFIHIFAKFAANTLFGALNSRHMLRARMGGPIIIGTSLFTTDAPAYAMQEVQVNITQETNPAIRSTEPAEIDIASKVTLDNE